MQLHQMKEAPATVINRNCHFKKAAADSGSEDKKRLNVPIAKPPIQTVGKTIFIKNVCIDESSLGASGVAGTSICRLGITSTVSPKFLPALTQVPSTLVLKLSQTLHRLIQIFRLRQNHIFQQRLIRDKSISRGDSPNGSIQVIEQFVGDARGDFCSVAPA